MIWESHRIEKIEQELEKLFLFYRLLRKQIQQTVMLEKKIKLEIASSHRELLTKQIARVRITAKELLAEHPIYRIYLSKIPIPLNASWILLSRLSPRKFRKASAIYKYIGLTPNPQKYDKLTKYILYQSIRKTLKKRFPETYEKLINKHLERNAKNITHAKKRAIRDFLRILIANIYDLYQVIINNKKLEKPSYYKIKSNKTIYPLITTKNDNGWALGKLIRRIKSIDITIQIETIKE